MESSAARSKTEDPTIASTPTMHYPIKGADGIVFDQAIDVCGDLVDPFYDECPIWCDEAATGHRHVETCDDDRMHYGERVGVPVRAIDGDLECDKPDKDNMRVVMGTAQMYLKRNVLERDAKIWLGKGESGSGFALSLDEAETLAGVLTQLVDEGRQ